MTNEEITKQLEIYFNELNDSLKKCNNGILHKSEVSEIIKDTINKVKKLLPEDSDQYRIFDKETYKRFLWTRGYPSDYVEREDCKEIEQLLDTLKEVLSNFEPDFISGGQLKTEFHFSKDEVVEAKLQVFEIMKKAEKSLIIMDAYAGQDNEIFKYINSINNESLEVQILTEKAIPIFKQLLKDLIKERGNIEAKKIGNVLHDRYLIIDHSEVWNIGVSADGIGKGYFTIKKLTDKEKIIEWFNELWAKAKNLDDENDKAGGD